MALTPEQRARLDALAAQKAAAQTPPPPTEEGFLTRLGGDLRKRAGEAYSTLGEAARGEISPVESGIRVVGQGVAAVGDVIGQGLTSAYRVAVPDIAKPVIEQGVARVAQAVRLPQALERYEAFSQQNPRFTKTLEGVVNIASALPAGKGAQVGVKAVKEGAEEAVEQAAKSWSKRVVSSIDQKFDRMFTKAVRPSVSQMDTPQRATMYLDKAKKAVNTILDNEPNLSLVDDAGEAVTLPSTLKQFSDAIEQTKKSVFQKYSQQATAAGERGAVVQLNNAADELMSMADNVVLQDKDPKLVDEIRRKADTLRKRGAYTPEQAQDAIRLYNESLEAFYRSPSYDTASKAAADAVVVNNIRRSLDEAISALEGPGYQELKNTYGALKAIEKDVAKRAVVDARKNVKGLIDFTDIATGAGAVNAILTMNPAQMAQAATAAAIKSAYKRLNDPNEIIKRLFKEVKKAREGAKRYNTGSSSSKLIPLRPTDKQKKTAAGIMKRVKRQNEAMDVQSLNQKR